MIILIFGAELFVRGASKMADILGISPLVVGLTVVAFGTSSPELAVGLQATLSGNSRVSIGNIIGINITNVLLILGLSAVIMPLNVASQLIRFDVLIMIDELFSTSFLSRSTVYAACGSTISRCRTRRESDAKANSFAVTEETNPTVTPFCVRPVSLAAPRISPQVVSPTKFPLSNLLNGLGFDRYAASRRDRAGYQISAPLPGKTVAFQ